ncbi:MAG: GGDEF domain-containing protein [Dehalococcoidia bacterium]|nr:GGDEF domain-containing protein [Dehalococcoidia bacterium]
MGGPWEDFQTEVAESGPWEDFSRDDEAAAVETPAKPKGLGGRMVEHLAESWREATTPLESTGRMTDTLPRLGEKILAVGAPLGRGLVGEPAGAFIKATLPSDAAGWLKAAGSFLADKPVFREQFETFKDIGEAWGWFEENFPRPARDIKNAAEASLLAPGYVAARELGPVTLRAAKETARGVKKGAGKLAELAEDYNFPRPTPEEALGQVLQGKSKILAKDYEKGKTALGAIDTKGVKTFEDLHGRIQEAIPRYAEMVDQELMRDPTPYKLKQLSTRKMTEGGHAATTNYVKTSMQHLHEYYTKIGQPEKALQIEEMWLKASTEGLTKKEINDLARVYGYEFKAWNPTTGEPLTSVNKKLYENVRSGLKDVARRGMSGRAKEIDSIISSLYNTRRLIQKNIAGVNRLQQKVDPRGLGEKIGRGILTAADLATLGTVKGAFLKLIPRGLGYQVKNYLDLENHLRRNLKIINKELDRVGRSKPAPFDPLAGDISGVRPGPAGELPMPPAPPPDIYRGGPPARPTEPFPESPIVEAEFTSRMQPKLPEGREPATPLLHGQGFELHTPEQAGQVIGDLRGGFDLVGKPSGPDVVDVRFRARKREGLPPTEERPQLPAPVGFTMREPPPKTILRKDSVRGSQSAEGVTVEHKPPKAARKGWETREKAEAAMKRFAEDKDISEANLEIIERGGRFGFRKKSRETASEKPLSERKPSKEGFTDAQYKEMADELGLVYGGNMKGWGPMFTDPAAGGSSFHITGNESVFDALSKFRSDKGLQPPARKSSGVTMQKLEKSAESLGLKYEGEKSPGYHEFTDPVTGSKIGLMPEKGETLYENLKISRQAWGKPIPERRVQPAMRKRFSEMTPEEQEIAFYTDDLTRLKNKKAWEEDPKKEVLVSMDMDDLKKANDTYTHVVGDQLIAKMGEALKRASGNTASYHVSGDEFWLQGNNRARLEKIVKKAKSILAKEPIDIEGKPYHVKFSHGFGKTEAEADIAMKADKAARKVQRGGELKLRSKAAKRPAEKMTGPQNLLTYIEKSGYLKAGKDYNLHELHQFPEGKRAFRQEGKLSPDEFADMLRGEGWDFSGSGDDLVELIKTGRVREIYRPEYREKLWEQKIEKEAYARAEEAVKKIKRQEGMDAGASEENRRSITAVLGDDIKSKGHIENEAALKSETDSFLKKVGIKPATEEKIQSGIREAFIPTISLRQNWATPSKGVGVRHYTQKITKPEKPD